MAKTKMHIEKPYKKLAFYFFASLKIKNYLELDVEENNNPLNIVLCIKTYACDVFSYL